MKIEETPQKERCIKYIALKGVKANMDLSLSLCALIRTTIGQVHLLGWLLAKDNLSFLVFFSLTLIFLYLGLLFLSIVHTRC